MAYVIGEAWFYGRTFTVDDRSARAASRRPKSWSRQRSTICARAAREAARCARCDVGTGSGAIAVR